MENFNKDFGPKVETFSPSSRRYWNKQCRSWIHQERPGIKRSVQIEEASSNEEAKKYRDEEQLEFDFTNTCTGEDDECNCEKCK